MDKELQDGTEQEDTWPGEGAEVLARNLLVDGETGESFPAQVLSPVLSPRNFLEKAVVSVGGTWVYILGWDLQVSHSEWTEKGRVDKQNRSRGARPW